MALIHAIRDQPRAAHRLLLASGRELPKATLFYLLHSAGWIALGVISILIDSSRKGPWPAVLEDVSWIACGWLITLGIRPVFQRARLKRRSYAAYGLLCLLFSIPGGALWYSSSEALLRLGYVVVSHFPAVWPIFAGAAQTDAAFPWWIPFQYWLFFSIIIFTWSSLYFGINAVLDLEAARANVAEARKLAETARLRALQSNLSPHFLFNTLNGIATLIRDNDVTSASAMVEGLSAFLRSTLQRLDTPEIRVSEELQLIEQYLRIQHFRFGEHLRTFVTADADVVDALLPTLILQPLVENAVRHGVLPKEDGGSLWVSIRKDEHVLVITVEDDGPGLSQALPIPVGLGLANSRDRLAALYGSAAQLTVGSRTEGGGFAVVMRLPFRRTHGSPALSIAEASPA